jgi:AcrR family transcriptional regulator
VTPAEPKAGRYHHGDLKTALVDGAIELIAERGLRGFSLAELSRRLGVTVAAPYRHFADRDELLASVGERALAALATEVGAGTRVSDPPEQRLAAMVGGYVRFAARQRPLFEVLYGANLDKERFPALRNAWAPVDDLVEGSVRQLCPEPAEANVLADALEAVAHGHAMLLIDQAEVGDAAIEAAAARAARAARAIIAGRAELA